MLGQQVHYPLQPGPMYFWHPENVLYSVFAVRVSLERLVTYLTAIITKCDLLHWYLLFQINYLIDESFK